MTNSATWRERLQAESRRGASSRMATAVPPSRLPGFAAPSPATASSPRDAASAAAATPVVSAPVTLAAAPSKALTLREVNAARVAFVVSRMASFFKGGSGGDPSYLIQPCYTLARGIDFSVTAGEVYANAHDLPPLIKQVYKFRNEASLQPAIMVLLISIKNACRKGWFQVAESNELLAMAKEVASNFCYGSVISEESKALTVFFRIMPRFYPQLKLDSLLVSLEAKPGYDILVAEFNVPKNMPPQEKIRLFIAQTDNMDTSSCLISPPHVNILVNGRGVERRISGSADVGPQFPTDLTKMLKYGTNLIQAVGFFSGNYVIAVAFMSTIATSGIPVLQDYTQPVVATVPQDAELIEGPSKISLNCPISFRRIKTPVKGHSCNHPQCFDYENFMAMNARKPSWRCPHCNQSVSFLDIRIDKDMVKILSETGEDVAHVVMSTDGSWKVVEHHDSVDKLQKGVLAGQKDDSIGCELDIPSRSLSDIVDLSMEEDAQAHIVGSTRQIESLDSLSNQCGNNNICDTEERKPFQGVFYSNSALQPVNFTSEAIQQTHGQVRDDLLSRISMATTMSVTTGNISGPYTQTIGAGIFAQSPFVDPIITDAISPTLNRDGADIPLLPTSTIQSSAQAQQFMDNLQFQQTSFGNSIVASETERQPIPRHVNRTPSAIQALPAQTQIASYHQRPRTSALNLSSVPAAPVQTSPLLSVIQDEVNAANMGTGRQQISETQQASRIPNLLLSSVRLPSVIQNRELPSSQYMLNPGSQQILGLPVQSPVNVRPLPNQQRGVSSFRMLSQTGSQSTLQQYYDIRTQQTMCQAASVAPQPPRLPSTPAQLATQGAANMVASSLANHNQPLVTQQSAQSARLQATLQASRTPLSFSTTGGHSSGEQVRNVGEGTPEPLRPNEFGGVATEQNWRPTGRMRGSLTGSAYSAALSHYMFQPNQSTPSRPLSADQNRAVSSEHVSLISSSANGSLPGHPSLRNEDPGGRLRA